MIETILKEELDRRVKKGADSELKRIREQVVKLNEKYDVDDVTSIHIKEIKDSLDFEIKLREEVKKEFIIENKVDGYRGILMKKGNEIKIYSDQEKDITFPFPTIVNQSKGLSKFDYVLDGELVIIREGKHLGRNELAKYLGVIKTKKQISDKNIKFIAFDCLYFNDKCTMRLQEYERKKLLIDNFKETENIKKIKPYLVRTPEEAKKVIEDLSKIKTSEGIIAKRIDWSYEPNKESDGWIKYRLETELHCVVLERYEVGK